MLIGGDLIKVLVALISTILDSPLVARLARLLASALKANRLICLVCRKALVRAALSFSFWIFSSSCFLDSALAAALAKPR